MIFDLTKRRGGNVIDDSVTSFSQVNTTAVTYLSRPNYDTSDYSYTYMSDYYDPTNTSLEKPLGSVIAITNAGTIYFVDETDGSGWSDTVSVGNYTVYNLIPTHTYKWWIKTSAGVTAQQGRIQATGSLRMIYVQNPHNFRDLGGWSCDGGTIKYGSLVRGAQLSYNNGVLATAADIKRLRDYGIKCEIDLRKPSETAGQDGVSGTSDDIISSVLGSDIEYLQYQFSDASYVDIINPTGVYANTIRSLMQKIIHNVIYDIPTYFHCAAGADRTGTIAFVIEGILGVAQYDQDRDYELTSFYGITPYARYRTNSSWTALINYMNNRSGNTWRNKFIQWALDLGINIDDLNAFRKALIDGTPDLLVESDYTISRIITNILDNGISTNNQATTVVNGGSYTAILTANTENNIGIKNVTVTMGGEDITSTVLTLTPYESSTTYTITKNLTNTSCSNNSSTIISGNGYSTIITADSGYELDSVTVTMGGVDITSTVYSNGAISIANVTGDIVITATATTIQLTNQIPISTESDGTPYNGGLGYKSGYRINSAGAETALAGKYVTGFIPISAGDHITFEGMSINSAAQDNNYIAFYDNTHKCLWSKYAYSWYSQTSTVLAPMTADNGNLTSITLTGGTYGGINYDFSTAAYMRVACNNIDSNSAIYID